jgi:integral membrane protein (TIGR01906 family)
MHSLIDKDSRDPKNAHDTLTYYYSYIITDTDELPKIPGMTDAELQHLRDVRHVWRTGLLSMATGALLLAGLMIYSWRKKTLHVALEWGSLVTIALMIIAGFVPFDSLWVWFHSLAFPQGNWVFEYNSRIIQLFPPAFFQDAALRIGLLCLFLAIVTYGVAMVLRWLAKRKMKTTEEAKDVTEPA